MATTEQISDSENLWLTVPEVMTFERISRRECYNRMRPGDSHPLAWKNRAQTGSKPGKLIYALSMSFEAQQRWRERALRAMAAPKVSSESGQGSLFERTQVDDEIEALSLPHSMRDVVARRFKIADQCLNHNWKALGYKNKRAFQATLAVQNGTSLRSVQRWTEAYSKSGKLVDLAPELRGPEPYTGTVLDRDMQAHLQRCWREQKLTVRQCYDSLVRYLELKQNSPGCRVDQLYKIPCQRTVARFVRSLDSLDQAARTGPEAMKAACGYIDRTYRDCKSLERVETDEFKLDFFSYLAERPQKVLRFYLLTFYDERSMYPLVWKLVEGDKFDKRHGVKEEDEIDLLVRMLKEYGVPGALVSDRGRFRGGTFGGNDRFKNADGILDRLGIKHPLPREKNPQGNRLERFHRFLADQCRTIPGWIGSNTSEREMTPGDAQKALHERWAQGDPAVPRTPLLSTDEALVKINEWMKQWREHPSEGTDMDGLSPQAVFQHNTPANGFTRLTDERIAFETAEHLPNVTIRPGGIIKLRDGKKYSHPALVLIQGEKREVVRLRDDRSKVSVLPAAKGEEAISAALRTTVGTHDPEALSREMEHIKRLRKLAEKMISPLELNPAAIEPMPPPASLPAREPEPELRPASLPCAAARQEQRQYLDFADLEL